MQRRMHDDEKAAGRAGDCGPEKRVPDGNLLPEIPRPAPASDCDPALRPVHGRPRQPGRAGAFRPVPGPGRLLRRHAGRNRGLHPLLRAVQDQGAGHPRPVPDAEKGIRRPGARHGRRPHTSARRGPQDGQPDCRGRLRQARCRDRHALHPHQRPSGPERGDQPP